MTVQDVYISNDSEARKLNEREKYILRTIIQLYILKAAPIGSRHLAKYLERELKLSPATIRNVMADLEEKDFISHPHTSAGRVPTDKGYRFYVDSIPTGDDLSEPDLLTLKNELSVSSNETVLKDASRLLGMLSRYLGIVKIPHLSDLIVQKIELISLSSNKLLVVIALASNIVRTVTLEAEFEIDYKYLEDISSYINEKISNKPLKYLKDNFPTMLNDMDIRNYPLVRLFVNSIDKIFDTRNVGDRIHIAGAPNLLNNPEFDDLGKAKGIIELIENEDIIIHLLDQYEYTEGGIKVIIGKEMQNELLEDYSLIVSSYNIGSASGSIGLIGPKRMQYSKMISLVDHVADYISHHS
ncbi:MAG: heat-inducible transcriptional repressor HrcA [FCB group bacterium]|jgi:heat-inducible transcriptional repressor